MQKFHALYLVAGFLLACVGCNAHDAAPGDEVQVNAKARFYFDTLDAGYKKIPGELVPQLVEEATWKSSPGVTVRSPELTIKPATVTWQTGNYRYSAEGCELSASCLLEIASDVEPGEHQLSVELPRVRDAALALGAFPRSPGKQDLILGGEVQVHDFTVHPSQAEKNFAVAWKTTLGIVIVVAVLAIGAWARSGSNDG